MAALILCLFFLLLPAGLLKIESRVKIISWLSPAFWCYALGILVGQIGPAMESVTQPFQTVSVVLAIPLLLFSSDVRQWLRLAPVSFLSYGLWILAVVSMAFAAFHLFYEQFATPAHMTAMAASVYVGGTPNMAAVQLATGAEVELFNQMNFTDLLLSGMYLLLVLTAAHRLLLKFLRPFKPASITSIAASIHQASQWLTLPFSQKALRVGGAVLMGGAVAGVAAGVSYLLLGEVSDLWVIVFLGLGGLAASMIPTVQKWPGTYETGEYLFLIFCVVVGYQVDVMALFRDGGGIILFMMCVAYGSI